MFVKGMRCKIESVEKLIPNSCLIVIESAVCRLS